MVSVCVRGEGEREERERESQYAMIDIRKLTLALTRAAMSF